MSTSTVHFAVHTSPDSSQPTPFVSNNLALLLQGWFRHAINSSPTPQSFLTSLLEFLQHPTFTFHITSNTSASSHPTGPLQLLSLVCDPLATNEPSWICTDTQPYPNLVEAATPLLPLLEEGECALVFLTSDMGLLVWDVYNAFDPVDRIPARLWQKYGVSELQFRQSLEDQPPPVIPTYLCETLCVADSSATFILGNDTEQAQVSSLCAPLPTLLQMFANQPHLLPLLTTLDSSFEISIAYDPRGPGRQTRLCNLRISGSCSTDALFYVQSSFEISATNRNVNPQIQIHLKNFLTSYFQWQALQRLFRSYDSSLVLSSESGKVFITYPGTVQGQESEGYLQWFGSEPGGYVRLPPCSSGLQLFGTHNNQDNTSDIVPSPLEGLSSFWEPLQIHLQRIQLAQFQC